MPDRCLLCGRDLNQIGAKYCLWDLSGLVNDYNDFQPGDYLCAECAIEAKRALGHYPESRSALNSLVLPTNMIEPNENIEIKEENNKKKPRLHKPKKLVDPKKIL